MSRRKPRQEPARCSCSNPVDTPEWTSKRGRRAGLTTRAGAEHGNLFTHRGGCIHSELSLTTRPLAKRQTVARLRLQ